MPRSMALSIMKNSDIESKLKVYFIVAREVFYFY